jgi:hypothetical protein
MATMVLLVAVDGAGTTLQRGGYLRHTATPKLDRHASVMRANRAKALPNCGLG